MFKGVQHAAIHGRPALLDARRRDDFLSPLAGGFRNGARAALLVHRGHEHGSRMKHRVDELNLPDFEFYAWDARGHGRSPGVRGYSPSFAASVRNGAHPRPRIASVRGETRRALRPPRPAIDAQDQRQVLRAVLREVEVAHDDPARQASFDSDPLITRAISVNILLEMHEAARRVVKDARAFTIPTQLLISGADFAVNQRPKREFFVNLGTPVKERHKFLCFFTTRSARLVARRRLAMHGALFASVLRQAQTARA